MESLGFGAAYAWAALAGGSTLAGNLTLLGVAGNPIMARGAERRGYRLGFRVFVRVGAATTLMDVAILCAYVLVV